MRSGSCRDSAWLLVQILRRLGLAARFVSGYLIQLQRRRRSDRGPERHGQGFHRSARLGRGLYPRRRLDRHGRDLGPVLRRRPSAAVRDAALPLGGADHRPGRAGAGRVRLRDECDARCARRRASPCPSPTTPGASSTRSARQVDRDLVAQDVRLTMGGEPTFVSIDDFDAPEWNTGGRRRQQAGARRDADPAPAGALRARRLPALRPGQMVSRREPAALGLRALLAQGRQADLAGPAADRRRPARPRRRPTTRRRERSPAKSPIAPRHRARLRHPGLRGRALLAAARERAAGQRRSARSEDRRSGRARAHGAHLRPRPVAPDRLRAAGAALERRGQARLAQRALAAAARQAVSRARRFAGRPAPAAEDAALRQPSDFPSVHEQDPMDPRGELPEPMQFRQSLRLR